MTISKACIYFATKTNELKAINQQAIKNEKLIEKTFKEMNMKLNDYSNNNKAKNEQVDNKTTVEISLLKNVDLNSDEQEAEQQQHEEEEEEKLNT